MPESGTSGSAGGALGPIHGNLYTGTQVETPDTAKRIPTGRAPAPYPEHRFTAWADRRMNTQAQISAPRGPSTCLHSQYASLG